MATITGIIAWLRGWFDDIYQPIGNYLSSSDIGDSNSTSSSKIVACNDTRLSDARTPTSHTHGNISNDGKIGSDSGKIITTGTNGVLTASSSITKSLISDFPSSMTPTSHEHSSSEVKDNSAYTNIGSSANATQKTINDKINTALGNKANSNNVYSKSETYTQAEITTLISNAVSNLQLFEVVSELPSSNIKSNRLYLIVNDTSITNNSYDIYLRVNNSWEQLDSLEFDISNFYNKTEIDTLLNGKVSTSDSRLTDTRTPKSHTHGNISNTGTLSGTSQNVVTDSNGVITTEAKPTIDTTITRSSSNAVTSSAIYSALANKQNTLTNLDMEMDYYGNTIFSNDGELFYSTNNRIYHDYSDTNELHFIDSNDNDVNFDDIILEGDSRLTDSRTPTSHTHTYGNITGVSTVQVLVTYTDDTTETLNLLKYTSS